MSQSFTLADVLGMPRRTPISSELADSMRYVEVVGIPVHLASREILRLAASILEWRYMDPILQTDVVLLMTNANAAREAAGRINGYQIQGATLKANVTDRWSKTSTTDMLQKAPHLKELKGDANSATLYYALPKDSVIESQRRLGAAFAAKNDTIGVAETRWVDSRENY